MKTLRQKSTVWFGVTLGLCTLSNIASAFYISELNDSSGCPSHENFYTYDHHDAYCELESPDTAHGRVDRNDFESGQSCLPFPNRGRTRGAQRGDAFRLDRIIRGAPPRLHSHPTGFDCLQRANVHMVIDLRGDEEGVGAEAHELRRRGIRSLHIPMNTAGEGGASASARAVLANRRSLVTALRAIRQQLRNDPEGRIYVHCAHGADRTGLLIGFYRMIVEGVSRQDALREMRRHGFAGQDALMQILNDPQDLREQVMAPLPEGANSASTSGTSGSLESTAASEATSQERSDSAPSPKVGAQ